MEKGKHYLCDSLSLKLDQTAQRAYTGRNQFLSSFIKMNHTANIPSGPGGPVMVRLLLFLY